VKTVPAGIDPVVVNATEMSLPAQTVVGVMSPVVIVWAKEETTPKMVAMQVKTPFLINVFFMYLSKYLSATD
jgi:hypothetical protein